MTFNPFQDLNSIQVYFLKCLCLKLLQKAQKYRFGHKRYISVLKSSSLLKLTARSICSINNGKGRCEQCCNGSQSSHNPLECACAVNSQEPFKEYCFAFQSYLSLPHRRKPSQTQIFASLSYTGAQICTVNCFPIWEGRKLFCHVGLGVFIQFNLVFLDSPSRVFLPLPSTLLFLLFSPAKLKFSLILI